MKNRLKSILLDLPGFEPLCRLLTRQHVRAFMYHRFSAEPTDDPRYMDSKTLKTHMDLITRHHDLWQPDQHLAQLTGTNKPKGKCPVIVTVDDGYADFHDVAYPVFRDAKLPAMLFVTTGFVDDKIWFWWDKIEYITNEATAGVYEASIGNGSLTLDLNSADGRQNAWHNISDRCRFLPNSKKEKQISDLAEDLDVDLPKSAPAKYAAVNWDQIRKMVNDGMLMGGHTIQHPILSRVDVDVAENEIRGSQQRLEAELGTPIPWFCYPQGGPADYTPEVKACVSKYYKGCYLAYLEFESLNDPFTMPRYCATRDTIHFRWILCGAEYLGLKIRRLMGKSTGAGSFYWAGSTDEEEKNAK